uniref:Uncharacterized protein MANES_S017800 n=1 Tax=Rhizophora mucronata TaxID=61149 RepID=A0A2P2PDC2_RHIMU
MESKAAFRFSKEKKKLKKLQTPLQESWSRKGQLVQLHPLAREKLGNLRVLIAQFRLLKGKLSQHQSRIVRNSAGK